MDWLEATLLGLVQGLTEFLPISSSGHLVMAETLLGIHGEGILFEIVVHVGTLVAILVYFRQRVLELVRGVLCGRTEALRYAGKLGVATVPAVVVGLALKDFIESLFDRAWLVGVALLVTGILLITTRRTVQTAREPEPSWGQALVIGIAQAVAIVPGISRSGTTVAVALALGVAPLAATEFSFLMAIIAIAGAAVLALPDATVVSPGEVEALAVGALVALGSGLAALWLFVRLLRSRRFHQFAYYVWAVGAAFLAWLLVAG